MTPAIEEALLRFNRELIEWIDSSDARLKDFDPLEAWGDVVAAMRRLEESKHH